LFNNLVAASQGKVIYFFESAMGAFLRAGHAKTGLFAPIPPVFPLHSALFGPKPSRLFPVALPLLGAGRVLPFSTDSP
jgi:hypothetical protein